MPGDLISPDGLRDVGISPMGLIVPQAALEKPPVRIAMLHEDYRKFMRLRRVMKFGGVDVVLTCDDAGCKQQVLQVVDTPTGFELRCQHAVREFIRQ